MSEASANRGPARPRLWTPEGFREDRWVHAESLEALAGAEAGSGVIVPASTFAALDEAARRAAAGRFGVLLAPGEPVELVLSFLDELPVIALSFPVFSDGRSYSKAERLRRRGYWGALRAVGDVLIDQIPHMLRTGFTEFEVKNPTALARLEAGRAGGLPVHYQPAAKPAAAVGRYAWRRRPAAQA